VRTVTVILSAAKNPAVPCTKSQILRVAQDDKGSMFLALTARYFPQYILNVLTKETRVKVLAALFALIVLTSLIGCHASTDVDKHGADVDVHTHG
jgi:hypothetical protein